MKVTKSKPYKVANGIIEIVGFVQLIGFIAAIVVFIGKYLMP
jgi:hypothetical protein